MNQLCTQQKANGEESKDQILDISQDSSDPDMMKAGLNNLFGDIIDYEELKNNMNYQHLIRATNHLKMAQNEFELAKKEMERHNMLSPEILR